MNETEAHAVARAVSEADGGCSTCAASIAGELTLDIPEIDWARAVWLQGDGDRLGGLEAFRDDVLYYRDQTRQIREERAAREATRP